MNEIELNVITYDEFKVTDSNGNLITGLIDGNFTRDLYNPSGSEVSGSITITITELGTGKYRASFTPNVEGNWILSIYHATYFPSGKSENYKCMTRIADIDAILIDTNEIQTKLPANYIMGSAVTTNKDDEIDDIKAETDKIQTIGDTVDSIELDTDTMEADLKTHMNTIETNIPDIIWNEDISTHGVVNSASIALRGTGYSIGTLTYDSVSGFGGTGYPIGTSFKPSNNLTDTILIMTYGKVNDLVIKSDLTIEASHNVSGFLIRTIGIMGTDVVLTAGCTAHQTSFRNINLSGTITNGDQILIYDSSIGNLANFTGIMNNVSFSQGSEVSVGYWAEIINGTSGGDPTNEVEINIGTGSLNVSHWTGNLKLIGKTGTNRTVINCDSGNIIIDSTCVAGTIQILGAGNIEANNSGAGCNVDTDSFVSINGISDGVWDELLSEHIVSGTFGQDLTTEANATSNKVDVLNAISTTESNIRGGTDTLDSLSDQIDVQATEATLNAQSENIIINTNNKHITTDAKINLNNSEIRQAISDSEGYIRGASGKTITDISNEIATLDSGTLGDINLAMRRMLGLSQHNIIIDNITRNTDLQIVEAHMTLYEDNTMITPLTSYTATYTFIDGLMTFNKVVED